MPTETLECLRIESRLSESFCLAKTENGDRIAAMNGYIVDYPTFCTMFIWYVSNTMGYSKILENRSGLIELLKNLNGWDEILGQLDGYHAINRVYNNMFKSLRKNDKKEDISRLLTMLRDR